MKHTINTITPSSHPDCYYSPEQHEIQVGQEVVVADGNEWYRIKIETDNDFISCLTNEEEIFIRKLLTRSTYPELFPDGVQDDLEALGFESDFGEHPRIKVRESLSYEFQFKYGDTKTAIIRVTNFFYWEDFPHYQGQIRNRFHLERIMADLGIRKEETK